MKPTRFLSISKRMYADRCAVGFVCVVMTLAGCASNGNRLTSAREAVGPVRTDPMHVVLEKINTNNQRITTLAGTGTFLATLGPEKQTLNGQITLLHTKPNKLWLRLNKDIAGDILIAGANDERFWLAAFGDTNTTWFGARRGIASTDPRLPISPELIADVLGVATLNLDLRAEPVPTMRFNPSYDAYMLTWMISTPSRWITLREIWYDRTTLEPRRVWLFDGDGRVTLKANLSDFRPMDVSTGDASAAPRVARSYDLNFPESGSRLTFRFDELRATRGRAPNDLTYRFDPTNARTAKVENLDDAATAAH